MTHCCTCVGNAQVRTVETGDLRRSSAQESMKLIDAREECEQTLNSRIFVVEYLSLSLSLGRGLMARLEIRAAVY